MPYAVSFRKKLVIIDRSEYLSDRCVGGDVIAERLVPTMVARYADVRTGQEEWGWFIASRNGSDAVAVDIVAEDVDGGAFRVHLTIRRKRWMLVDTIVDGPALEELRELVTNRLTEWADSPVHVVRVDEKYNPVAPEP